MPYLFVDMSNTLQGCIYKGLENYKQRILPEGQINGLPVVRCTTTKNGTYVLFCSGNWLENPIYKSSYCLLNQPDVQEDVKLEESVKAGVAAAKGIVAVQRIVENEEKTRWDIENAIDFKKWMTDSVLMGLNTACVDVSPLMKLGSTEIVVDFLERYFEMFDLVVLFPKPVGPKETINTDALKRSKKVRDILFSRTGNCCGIHGSPTYPMVAKFMVKRIFRGDQLPLTTGESDRIKRAIFARNRELSNMVTDDVVKSNNKLLVNGVLFDKEITTNSIPVPLYSKVLQGRTNLNARAFSTTTSALIDDIMILRLNDQK